MGNIVKIIDSMMGTGKTSYAIQLMKEAEINQKFIFVTPYLDEVQRIKQEIINRDFKEPNVNHGSGTKLESLKRLIAKGEDIVTTHALFALADEELIELLSWSNYTLIMDEVMEVIAQVKVKKGDIQMMLKGGAIEVDAGGKVTWKEHPKFDTTFSTVRDFALARNLYLVNNVAFVWNFPAKIFDLFDRVYIMTYMFDGQLQKYYYDLHSIQYEYYSVVKEGEKYDLQPKSAVKEDHSDFKKLIQIYEGKINDIGEAKTALSKSWFENSHNKGKVKSLKDNLYNFLRNVHKAPAEKILWTTFKDFKKKTERNGFRKEESDNPSRLDIGQACFIPFNLRATNKYKHKDVLAFCLNRFINPIEEHFFEAQNVKVNEDLLALSDLLQWIFR
ncbi:DEAD/DEAH box helicase family protein [Neobacillus sp. NPDC093127]|uniref:DEAD/DEAH box helicase family protein n=1 Tax=Neobacillus sp. NPDC093127 TaxID=3364296 RepID=UPI00381379C3